MRDNSQQFWDRDGDHVPRSPDSCGPLPHSSTAGPSLVDDLSCPICMSLLRDPFVTACGHTFCCSCLTTHLDDRSTCPSCGQYLIKDSTYPNFMLSKVVARLAAAEKREKKSLARQMEEDIRAEDSSLTLQDVNTLLHVLWEKKESMEKQEAEASLMLLLQFLHHARVEKTRKLKELQEELTTLDADIQQVEVQAGAAPSPSRNKTAELLRKRLRECQEASALEAPTSSPLQDFPEPLDGPPPAGALQHREQQASMAGRMLPPPPLRAPAGIPALASLPPLSAGLMGAHQTGSADVPQLVGRMPLLPGPSAAGLGWHSPHAPQHGALMMLPAMHMPVSAPSSQPSLTLDWPNPVHHGHLTPTVAIPSTSPSLASNQPPASASLVATTTTSLTTTNSGSSSGALAASQPTANATAPPSSSLVSVPSGPPSVDTSASEPDPVRARKRRVVSQFEDLQACYLNLRRSESTAASALRTEGPPPAANGAAGPSGGAGRRDADADADADEGEAAANGAAAEVKLELAHRGDQAQGPLLDNGGLAEFSRMLSVFTHCSRLKVIAELPRASSRQPAAILSSIEFDRDRSVFATAGVSKRISLFDYATVLAHPHVQHHCPAAELVTRSKLSCLSWNKYVRNHIISSDYEGCVTLWDVDTGTAVNEYEAHDKRIWSVDYCTTDPFLFVSGSDDGFIKVWSTKQAAPAAAIDLRANVCCVKYNPASTHELAVGSADHNVHLYDLRNVSAPVHVFAGHRKAVSYVRYLNSDEVISASTDNTLRLWNARTFEQTRTFSGHTNEKNFVGLAVDSEFIACGSETNEVFVYYRTLAKPIAKRLFSSPSSSSSGGHPSDGTQFISAVCWKPQAQTLLAANSQGCIKVMQLTS